MPDNIIYDLYDKARSMLMPSIDVELPHVIRAFFAEIVVTQKGKPAFEFYKVVSGDYLSKIATAQDTTVAEILKANPEIKKPSSIQPGLEIKIPSYVVEGKMVEFKQIDKATIGTQVYLVVETKNLRCKTIQANIKQGVEAVLTEVDGALDVDVNGERKTLLELKVSDFAETSMALNKDEFLDYAILEIGMKAKEEDEHVELSKKIKESASKAALLYILVDAHSGNTDIPKKHFSYYGRNEGTDSFTNQWLDMEGRWFRLEAASWHEPILNPQRLLHNSGGNYSPRSGAFGKVRRVYNEEGELVKKVHAGVDVYAPIGTPVFACLDGVVKSAKYRGSTSKKGYGNTIVLEVDKADLDAARISDYKMPYKKDGEYTKASNFGDSDDRFLLYAHLDTMTVQAGDKVLAGQQIGTSGKTGNASTIKSASNRHLHFEVLDTTDTGNYYKMYNRENAAFYINFVEADKTLQANNTD